MLFAANDFCKFYKFVGGAGDVVGLGKLLRGAVAISAADGGQVVLLGDLHILQSVTNDYKVAMEVLLDCQKNLYFSLPAVILSAVEAGEKAIQLEVFPMGLHVCMFAVAEEDQAKA